MNLMQNTHSYLKFNKQLLKQKVAYCPLLVTEPKVANMNKIERLKLLR